LRANEGQSRLTERKSELLLAIALEEIQQIGALISFSIEKLKQNKSIENEPISIQDEADVTVTLKQSGSIKIIKDH